MILCNFLFLFVFIYFFFNFRFLTYFRVTSAVMYRIIRPWLNFDCIFALTAQGKKYFSSIKEIHRFDREVNFLFIYLYTYIHIYISIETIIIIDKV